MTKIDDDIEDAKQKLSYYFNKRQKHLDNRDKFGYYHERTIIKEENLARLINKKRLREEKKRKKKEGK